MSEPRTLAPGPGFLVRRRLRGRSVDAVRSLIDSRLFRLLCAPGEEAALAGFRASAARAGLAPSDGLPPLELTPLAFLDAIGVEAPQPDPFPLPPSVLKSGESLMATSVVVKLIEERFREAPELKPDALRKQAEELRGATEPAAHELFDLCVTRVVSAEGFVDPIIRQLSFDFVYRFPFPEVLREEVFEFLCASLFAAGETVSGLSKMRTIKVLWERAYPRLLKRNPGAREEVQALDRVMRLRVRKDFLAWEVIHHAVLGFAVEEGFQPVTAFTLEPEAEAEVRCIAYKSALRAFLDQISPDDLAKIRPKLDAWRPGAVVPCQEGGTFASPVPTGDLPIFVGMK